MWQGRGILHTAAAGEQYAEMIFKLKTDYLLKANFCRSFGIDNIH